RTLMTAGIGDWAWYGEGKRCSEAMAESSFDATYFSLPEACSKSEACRPECTARGRAQLGFATAPYPNVAAPRLL
ncbi:MAG: hypothetical protein J5833_05670, partial [Victivallales bacterium]|nr:hypothetical protein [Victivallales bacterium]